MAAQHCYIKEEPSETGLNVSGEGQCLLKQEPPLGDCGLEAFLQHDGRDDDALSASYGGGSHGMTVPPPWLQALPQPGLATQNPLLSATEVSRLLQRGRCRLQRCGSRSRLWRRFSRVVADGGREVGYVACGTCGELLPHRPGAATTTLTAHISTCHPHADSPESPPSRSSESVSPQSSRDDGLSPSQLFFSQHLLQQQLQQQLLLSPYHLTPSPPLPPPLIMEQHNGSVRTASPSFFPPRFAVPPGAVLRSPPPVPADARRKRSQRHRLEALRRLPPQEIAALSRGQRADDGSGDQNDKETAAKDDPKVVSICQKAVLDAAVAFCCLDGRWFDSVSGRGLRELSQAFVNIGAQFGTMPAEQLLPAPLTVRSRAAEMAELKRAQTTATLKEALPRTGGCLALSVRAHEQAGVLACCSLHVSRGDAVQRGVMGVWQVQDGSGLCAGLRRVMKNFGIDTMREHLTIIHDGHPLTECVTRKRGTLRCSTSEGRDGSVSSSEGLPPSGSSVLPAGEEAVSSSSSLSVPMPCATYLLNRTITSILNNINLDAAYRRTLQENARLLRVVNRLGWVADWARGVPLDNTWTESRQDGEPFSLSQVKFTLQHRKQLEQLISQSLNKVPHDVGSLAVNIKYQGNESRKSDIQNDSSYGDAFQKKEIIQHQEGKSATDTLTEPSTSRNVSSSCNNAQRNYEKKKVPCTGSMSILSQIMSKIDFDLLNNISEYFEPFEAALNDLLCEQLEEPSMGKLVPWVQTLKQYATDSATTAHDRTDALNVTEENGDEQKKEQTNNKANGDSSSDLSLDERENILGENDIENQDSSVKEKCEKYSEDTSDQVGLSLQELGKQIIDQQLQPHPAHYVATFLTPHFKSLAMLNEGEKNRTYEWVKKLCMNKIFIGSDFFDNLENNEYHTAISNKAENATRSFMREGDYKIIDNRPAKASLEQSSSKNPRDMLESTKSDASKERNPTLKALLQDDPSYIVQDQLKISERNLSENKAQASIMSASPSSDMNVHASYYSCSNKRKQPRHGDVASTTENAKNIEVDAIKKAKFEYNGNNGLSTERDGRNSNESFLKNIESMKYQNAVENENTPQPNFAPLSSSSQQIKTSACETTWKSEEPAPDHTSRNKMSRRFTSIAHFMQSNAEQPAEEDLPIDLELYRYKNVSFPPASANLLLWWRQNSTQLPLLAGLAFRLLAGPVSVRSTLSQWNLEKLQTKIAQQDADENISQFTVEGIDNLMFLVSEW